MGLSQMGFLLHTFGTFSPPTSRAKDAQSPTSKAAKDAVAWDVPYRSRHESRVGCAFHKVT